MSSRTNRSLIALGTASQIIRECVPTPAQDEQSIVTIK